MLYLTVDLGAIKSNIQRIRNHILGKKLYAVVKANAYGVGINVAKFIEGGVDGLCVANAYELTQLRKIGCDKKVLILGAVENCDVDESTIVSISSFEELNNLRPNVKNIALKINTGMNRLGCNACDFEKLYYTAIRKGYKIDSVFSHLYNVTNKEISEKQFEIFDSATSFLKGKIDRHLCASNCLIMPPKFFFNGVRAGLSLYGYGYENLSPALCLYGVIEQINYVKKGQNIGYGNFVAQKDMVVATVSVGYGDGISATAKLQCIINGQKCYSVGQICMDFMSVDVSEVNCKVGDRVYFLCEQIKLEEFANAQRKIMHESLCSLSARVRRIYCDR